ncbi:MAG: ABC transporter substrate-binding protein, partial [Candidatus Omnitrophota bacterium]|nr:ABC transporter substrate-binding protein [Candidatus Omnitrophota bacterium]
NDDQTNIQEILKKFLMDKVDLIFVFPLPAAVRAKAAIQGTNIPVVFAICTIEGSNLVKSVRQPGGNITGVRNFGPELVAKRLELLLEIAPNTKRVWVTYDENYPLGQVALNLLRLAAKSLGVELVEVPGSSIADVQADLSARAKAVDIGIDAMMIMSEPISAASAYAFISKFASEHKIPLAGLTNHQVHQGSLFTFFPSEYKCGQLAASLVDKILTGTPAGTIPVVTPEADLRINYKRAKELGLNVSEGLLSRASEIIH